MDLNELTIVKTQELLKKKEFSALELTKAFLDKIEKEDKEISAFLTLTADFALSQAKKVDDMIFQQREIPFLAGLPLAIKDNILVEGVRCTAGSRILEDYIAPYDATVIKKLKEKKVVILGKTNLDEFAMGSSTENSAFFTTKNPLDFSRVAGGSSGGSAAAVRAGFCLFALGSDTGGSIRQPASFCGVVGLKPTYGAVSRQGLIAFASSLDQIGPITKNVEDCQIVFDAIKDRDELDSTSIEMPKIQNAPKQSLRDATGQAKHKIQDIKIGLPKEYFVKGMEPGVEKTIKEAIKKYEKTGIKFKEVSLPHTEYALSCYYIVAPSEASANLARYDGIKYGYSKVKEPAFALAPASALRASAGKSAGKQKTKKKELIDVYLESRGEGFGQEVRRRIMLGTYALSAGYYDAYYLRAQKVRTRIKEDFDRAFEEVDFILTSTSPTVAFKIGEKIADPLTMYLSDIYTIAVNLAGLPALSFPCPVRNSVGNRQSENSLRAAPKEEISNEACGKTGELPVGLQIIGRPFQEQKIFQIAELLEKFGI